MKKLLLIFFPGIAVISAVVIVSFYLGQKSSKQSDKVQSQVTPVPTQAATLTPKVQTGTIEGSLGFPSEGIPEDMTVCAEDTKTNSEYCTSKHLKNNKYTYGVGYKIEVPVADYLVYATVPDYQDGYRAYYSEFVTCGLSINCTSHEPIMVTVSAGQTVDGVNPQDWYNQD